MKPKIKLPTYEVEAGSDGTGFKFGHAWDRTYVYENLRRKPKKLIAVDAKIGNVSEQKVAVKHIELLKENGIKLKKFYGDGAYDTMVILRKQRLWHD